MGRRKEKPPETFTGSYSAFPHRVHDSQAFIGATDRAKSLLFALMRQVNGSNNGRLQLTDKWLKKQGWPSKGQNAKAREELIERGLVVQTRQGGLNAGCNKYAVTWLPISNFIGLDIAAANYHQGAWGDCKLLSTTRRKAPQKRETPPDQRGSTTPISGARGSQATPTNGAKKAILAKSAAPTSGNNVLIPVHTINLSSRNKRIVGKKGCSWTPKQAERTT